MPGMTFRLSDADHQMLKLLALKTRRPQNRILTDLLREEFERQGISRLTLNEILSQPTPAEEAKQRRAFVEQYARDYFARCRAEQEA